MTNSAPAKLLLTAPPKTGKTTVISRLVELLGEEGLPAMGFVTTELRGNQGSRVGFVVRSLDGDKAVIAHQDFDTGVRVGRYGVDVPAFERVALPVMERLLTSDAVAIIDEIARMELALPASSSCSTKSWIAHIRWWPPSTRRPTRSRTPSCSARTFRSSR